MKTAEQIWAQKLVDNVATALQLDPEKGELPHAEDWRRNAENLFKLAIVDGKDAGYAEAVREVREAVKGVLK